MALNEGLRTQDTDFRKDLIRRLDALEALDLQRRLNKIEQYLDRGSDQDGYLTRITKALEASAKAMDEMRGTRNRGEVQLDSGGGNHTESQRVQWQLPTTARLQIFKQIKQESIADIGQFMMICPHGYCDEEIEKLESICSEFGLIYSLIIIEIKLLQHLCNLSPVPVSMFSAGTIATFSKMIKNFCSDDVRLFKSFELHDKCPDWAGMQFLKEKLKAHADPQYVLEIMSGTLQGSDIYKVAFMVNIKSTYEHIFYPVIGKLLKQLMELAKKEANSIILTSVDVQAGDQQETSIGQKIADWVGKFIEARKTFSVAAEYGKSFYTIEKCAALKRISKHLDWDAEARYFLQSLGFHSCKDKDKVEVMDYAGAMSAALVSFIEVLDGFLTDARSWSVKGDFRMGNKSNNGRISEFEESCCYLRFAKKMLESIGKLIESDLDEVSFVLRNYSMGLAYALVGFKHALNGGEKLMEHAISHQPHDNVIAAEERTKKQQKIAESIEAFCNASDSDRCNFVTNSDI